MVSSFKALRSHTLPIDEEKFNTVLGHPHITSEHTRGILKACFPFIQSKPMLITDQKDSVHCILRGVCVLMLGHY